MNLSHWKVMKKLSTEKSITINSYSKVTFIGTLLIKSHTATRKQTKSPAYMATHWTGDINAEYHHGALVAMATGGCCRWSRADHVSDVRLGWNLVDCDVNHVPLVTELTLPDLTNNDIPLIALTQEISDAGNQIAPSNLATGLIAIARGTRPLLPTLPHAPPLHLHLCPTLCYWEIWISPKPTLFPAGTSSRKLWTWKNFAMALATFDGQLSLSQWPSNFVYSTMGVMRRVARVRLRQTRLVESGSRRDFAVPGQLKHKTTVQTLNQASKVIWQ